MKVQEFVELVARLRSAQHSYERTRNYADYDLTINLGRQVDNALRDDIDDDNQLSLFNH